MRKNQDKHKNVIHAQRILDQVAGKKIESVMRTFKAPHERVKAKRYQHPQAAPLGGSAHTQFAIAPFEGDQINSDRDKDAHVKGDPKPNAGCHSEEVFTSREARQSQIAEGHVRVAASHETHTSHSSHSTHTPNRLFPRHLDRSS
jgi:hypothetical protein